MLLAIPLSSGIALRDKDRSEDEAKIMKKIHLAIAARDIKASITDYTKRLGCEPCLVVADHYALWRTEFINMSVRKDLASKPGEIRHLGWEDSEAKEFTTEKDVNGITWEYFSAEQQAEEIKEIWPGLSKKE